MEVPKIAGIRTEVRSKIAGIVNSLNNAPQTNRPVLNKKSHNRSVLDVNLGEIIDGTTIVKQNPFSDKRKRVSSFFIDSII